ncbi:MAG: hypothetical protein DI619_03555 [Francisella sp.]|jgi:chaperone surA|nr:MAG: hypothetical protein DI619_03555 [Francisella sp.]
MKFNKSISAVIIGLSLSMMTANPVQWVDRIVVVVNNDVITQRDIEDISTRIARSLPKNEAGKVSAMDIEKMAIGNLIQERLLKQAAENIKIKVSEEDIDQEISKLAKEKNMDVARFYQQIEKEGVSKALLRKTIRDNLMVTHLVKSVSGGGPNVSDQEIQQLLEQNHMQANQQNVAQAKQYIIQAKNQQLLGSILQEMQKAALIEYRKKPY